MVKRLVIGGALVIIEYATMMIAWCWSNDIIVMAILIAFALLCLNVFIIQCHKEHVLPHMDEVNVWVLRIINKQKGG